MAFDDQHSSSGRTLLLIHLDSLCLKPSDIRGVLAEDQSVVDLSDCIKLVEKQIGSRVGVLCLNTYKYLESVSFIRFFNRNYSFDQSGSIYRPRSFNQLNAYLAEHLGEFDRILDLTQSRTAFQSLKFAVSSQDYFVAQFGSHGVDGYGWPGLQEVLRGDTKTRIVLLRLRSSQSALKLSERFIATDLNSISLQSLRLTVKSLELLDDIDLSRSLSEAPTPLLSSKTVSLLDAVSLAAELAGHLLRRLTKKYAERGKHMRWTLHVAEFSEDFRNMVSSWSIAQPQGVDWADPFLFKKGDTHYVFFEEYDFERKKGAICCAKISKANGFESTPVKVLESDYHYSYPYVFELDDSIYMIPETHEKNQIELYVADEFPLKWRLERVLIEDVRAVDSSIFWHEGRWWLFTNISESGNEFDELHLFYCDDIFRDRMIPHACNPVVMDVETARGGGKIFLNDQGKIIRPSQDCTVRYGRNLNLMEIKTLSPDAYAEVVYSKIEATESNSFKGIHTLAHSDDITLVDKLELSEGRLR